MIYKYLIYYTYIFIYIYTLAQIKTMPVYIYIIVTSLGIKPKGCTGYPSSTSWTGGLPNYLMDQPEKVSNTGYPSCASRPLFAVTLAASLASETRFARACICSSKLN